MQVNTAELDAWLAANGGADASDICSDVTWSNDFTALSDDCGATGSATVTFRATDDCDNYSETTATFTIEDTTPPEIELPVVEKLCNDDFPAQLSADWTDACSEGGTVYANPTNIRRIGCSDFADYVFTATDDCGNSTTETLTVEREFDLFENCTTAFARLDEESQCFIGDGFNRWGWTNQISPSETDYIMPLYTGAAGCDIANGVHVGNATISYWDGEVTVTYDLFAGYVLTRAHVYIGCDPYPNIDGEDTVAPGQYNFNAGILDYIYGLTVSTSDASEIEGDLYVIVHAKVCEETCRCSLVPDDGVFEMGDLSLTCEAENLNSSSFTTGNDNDFKVLDNTTFKAYPVPFNNAINVEYKYEYDTDVRIDVFDAKGALILTEYDSNYSKGISSSKTIDLYSKASQTYIIKVTTNRESSSKMVVADNK